MLAVSMVLLAVASPAGHAATRQDSDPAAPDPTLRLVSQTGWVGPVGTFRVQIETPVVPPGAEVTARLYREVTSRTALERTARGESLGSLIAPPVQVPLVVAPAAPGDRPTADLGYQIVDTGTHPTYGFKISGPGVYPLELTITDGQGEELGQLVTHLIRLPDATDDDPPLSLAVVVPVGAPLAHQPDGSIDLADDQVAALDALLTTLSRYPAVPVSITPTPETVDALQETDRRAGTTLATRLRAATQGREALSNTYVPVADGSWIDQGLTDRFQQQLAAGADTLAAALAAPPQQGIALVGPATTPGVLALRAGDGVDQAVVPSNRLERTSSRDDASPLTQTFELATGDGGHVRAVATDTVLGDRLTATDDHVLDAHEVLADLTLVSLDTASQACVADTLQTRGCSRGVALQLPADAAAAQPALEVLLAALADRTGTGTDTAAVPGRPVLSPQTATALLGVVDPASAGSTGPSSPVRERDLTTVDTPSLGTYPSRLETVAGDVGGFRSMLTGDDPTGLDLADSLDQVMLSSGSTSLDDAGQLAYLDGAQRTVQSQTAQITTEEQQVVTLTSGDGRIPISVSNALAYPVRVRIHLSSPKLEFPDGNELEVDLPADTPTLVQVQVQVRASGAFPLEVKVRSLDDTLLLATSRFNVRSTAVSGLGLILTIAAGLFLLLWWARHFRNTRRGRKLVASSHPVLRPTEASTPPATQV